MVTDSQVILIQGDGHHQFCGQPNRLFHVVWKFEILIFLSYGSNWGINFSIRLEYSILSAHQSHLGHMLDFSCDSHAFLINGLILWYKETEIHASSSMCIWISWFQVIMNNDDGQQSESNSLYIRIRLWWVWWVYTYTYYAL